MKFHVQDRRRQVSLLRQTIFTEKISCFNTFISKINFQRGGKRALKFMANIKKGKTTTAKKHL